MLNNDKIEFNVEDLKKLIDLHSGKKNGGITYQDFCKWIGS
jgi:Ca2+-binding EF-hand superfamily protein